MASKNKSKIIISSIVAAAAVGVLVAYMGTTGDTTDIIQTNDSVRMAHSGLIETNVNELARDSDVIVVGTVTGIGSPKIVKLVQGEVQIALTPVTVSIEQELTGNYLGKEIQVTVEGDGQKYIVFEEAELTVGESVLLFLTHTDASTIYGDAYVTRGGFQAKFSIDENGVAHNPKHGDILVQQLVSQILEARARK